MRRLFAGLLALSVLLMPLRIGLAFSYTDDEDLISVSLPDSDDIVVYADDDAYLPEEMHALAASYELDARLQVRSYTPQDVLGYTLDIIACPVRNLDSGEPARQVPAGRAAFTDITDAAYREEAVTLVRSMYGERFTTAAARADTFHGVPAMEISGTGASGSYWAGYDLQVYLIANDQRLLVIAAVYLDSEETAVQSLLDSVSLDGQPSVSAPQTTTPASAARAENAGAAAATAAPAAAAQKAAPLPADQNAPPQWLQTTQTYLRQHTEVIYYALAALGVLILAVALIVYHRSKRRQSWTMDDENAGHLDMRTAGTRRHPHRRAGHTSNKEGNMEASGRAAGSGRREYDYTEDISRYTQQPGPDVNDVSRYTHGYEADDSLSEELKALQDEPIAMPKPIKIQSVGSRVERNRKKRRK